MRFTQQDFDGLLECVRDLYDHRGLADFEPRTAGWLLRLSGAERVVHGDFDVERQCARLSMQPAVVKENDGTVDGVLDGALDGLERRFADHPLFRYYLQTGDGHAVRLSQAMTRLQLQKYRATDGFARQFGARFQMGVFFAAGPRW